MEAVSAVQDRQDASSSAVTLPARQDDICCFGMILGLPLKPLASWEGRQPPVPLDYADGSGELRDSKNGSMMGTLGRDGRKVIEVLKKDIIVQIFAAGISVSATEIAGRNATHAGKSKKPSVSQSLQICLNLYGPTLYFEDVGAFAARCRLFLQPPKHCNLNVPYRNPHCLSSEDPSTIYTFDLQSAPRSSEEDAQIQMTYYINPIDLFADTMIQDTLAESKAPLALATELYPHQKQALTFMLQREQGWSMDDEHKDIWKEERELSGSIVYRNLVSGSKQSRTPHPFRGGLLIDAPGLGKSLSILALIASKADDRRGSTLIIVPTSLIQMWKDELQKHLKAQHALSYCVYYGKNRSELLRQVDEYAIVITTYSVVRLDWKKWLEKDKSNMTLHTVCWERIVLDEGHIIRAPTKSFAKSVQALEARKRWAVTGTPIQNRLTDLFSLFKFLRCSPFDELGFFNAQVVQKWKARSDPESVAKLKLLVNCLSLRRPKTTITLPHRSDETKVLRFDEQEFQNYQSARGRALGNISSIESGRQSHERPTFFNTLKWLNELRLICNHGIRDSSAVIDVPTPAWSPLEAQALFDALEDVGLAKCSNTMCCQELASALMSMEGSGEHSDEPWISESWELWCSSCYDHRTPTRTPAYRVCNHTPRRFAKKYAGEIQLGFDLAPHLMAPQTDPLAGTPRARLPTKIRALVQDLVQTNEETKSVVFSSWTKTLNIIGPQLRAHAIDFVQLDGTLSATRRSSVLDVFRKNPKMKVLLATISCGGIGLDLTAASRAYIMEPQWNPMSESQALDRIYRLGQTKEVTFIKYIMRGSWEEQVLKLQEKKQELADLAVNDRDTSKADLSHGRLQHLKDLLR